MTKVHIHKRALAYMEPRPPEGKIEISVPPLITMILESKKSISEKIVHDNLSNIQKMRAQVQLMRDQVMPINIVHTNIDLKLKKLYDKYSKKISNADTIDTVSTESQFSEITTAKTITYISKVPEPELKVPIYFSLDGPQDRNLTKWEPYQNIVKMKMEDSLEEQERKSDNSSLNMGLGFVRTLKLTTTTEENYLDLDSELQPNFKFRKKFRKYYGNRRKKTKKNCVRENGGFCCKIIRNFKKKNKKNFILQCSMDTMEPWTMQINDNHFLLS